MNQLTLLIDKIFGGHKAQIGALLTVTHKHALPVRLILPHHDRLSTALVCSLVNVQHKEVTLECNKVLVPDSINNEECTIYLKVEADKLPSSLLEPGKIPQTGYMCSSRVIRNDVDRARHTSVISCEFPHKYIARELRRYERVRPQLRCIHTLVLWPNGGMPRTLRELGAPMFVTRPQGHPQIHLVDISVGGAKIQLHGVDHELALGLEGIEHNMTFLVSLALVAKNEPLSILVSARCLEVCPDPRQRSAVLRLCFESQGIMQPGGGLIWTHLKDGVPQLTTWIEHDFHVFDASQAHETRPGVL